MRITKKIILFLLAFYFSCGSSQSKILPSVEFPGALAFALEDESRNLGGEVLTHKAAVVAEQLSDHNNVHGETIATNNKFGHADAHFVGGGKGGNGGEESRSPSNQGSPNVIPIYAANAHHNHHSGAATSHKSHKLYSAFFTTMFLACLIA